MPQFKKFLRLWAYIMEPQKLCSNSRKFYEILYHDHIIKNNTNKSLTMSLSNIGFKTCNSDCWFQMVPEKVCARTMQLHCDLDGSGHLEYSEWLVCVKPDGKDNTI